MKTEPTLLLQTNICGSDRGPGQKVFSYGFFSIRISRASVVDRKYFEGIELNASLIRKHRPDWFMRIYHNSTSAEQRTRLCDVACSNRNVDLCDVSEIQLSSIDDLNTILPTIWRFLPMADTKVGVV
jgi:hypothetical protein